VSSLPARDAFEHFAKSFRAWLVTCVGRTRGRKQCRTFDRRRVERRHHHDCPPDRSLGPRKLGAQALLHTEQQFGGRWRRHQVAVHDGGTAGPPYAPHPLREAGRVPREIQVHHHVRVLQVHPLGQHVGGQQQRDALTLDGLASAVGTRSEARQQ